MLLLRNDVIGVHSAAYVRMIAQEAQGFLLLGGASANWPKDNQPR